MPEWLTATPDTGTLYGVADSARINFVSQPLTGGIYYDTISAGSLGYPEEEIYITIQTAGGPELVVDPVSLEIQAAEGSTTFEISSNTAWTLDETTDWLSVNPVSGGGDAVITVYYDENTTGFVRNGGITITAAGGLLPLTVSINQRVWLIHTVNLPKGWSGLSSYLMPGHDEIQGIYADIIDNLVIAVTEDAIYYPAENINTIGNWAPQSAYKVKTNMAVSLNISGEIEENRTLQLEEGWNLIPVISACPVDVESLFAPVVNDLVIVKEVAGYGVYWPEMGINNLSNLNPGEAYFVLISNATTITFDACTKNTELIPTNNENYTGLIHWDIFMSTPISHSIAILADAIKGFEQGSIIGIFDKEEHCWGLSACEKATICLTAFGDDHLSIMKHGFENGEIMFFRIYVPSTREEHEIYPVFDKTLHDANSTFAINGISKIAKFKMTPENSAIPDLSDIIIFPNPTMGSFTITGIENDNSIEITDMHGQRIQNTITWNGKSLLIDLSGKQPGVYIVRILHNDKYVYKKLILK